jgi:hypothetical protein
VTFSTSPSDGWRRARKNNLALAFPRADTNSHNNHEKMSLSLYKPLGDNDEATRLNTAKQLSSELSTLLAGERTEKSKSDVDYALKRLTKGIASGRDSARPGFAVVLTEVTISSSRPHGEKVKKS